MALVQVTVPYRDNYDYGIGVDLTSSSPMGKVVDGAVSGVEGAGGATASYDVTCIHTTSELETKLGIDAEASYGCSAFAGVSARFNYAKQSKIQSSSLFMTVIASVVLEVLSIDDPTLTPAAAEIVNRADVFSTRYGNMFVRGIGRGGMFIGVIQINTSSSQESESISVELEGSYGLFSAEAKTKFENLRKNYSSEIRITVYHEGGPINLSMRNNNDPVELYELMQKFLQSFQDDPGKNAKPYYVTLAPIAIANGPIPPNVADIQHAQDILIICAKQRSTILDGLNLMDYIVQNTSRYDFVAPTTPDDILKAFVGYQADLTLVAATASQAINDVTKAVTPAEFALKVGKPYPQGVPPTPMPTLKQGLPQPKTVPNFVGLTLDAAYLLSQQTGVAINEFAPDDANDYPSRSWQLLMVGMTDESGNVYSPHSLNELVVEWQEQSPGSTLLSGATVYLAIALAPGVPR